MGLSANTKLGPYVVLGPLKSGGMGEVYRAHDTQLDRMVALKVLRADLVGDSGAIVRFQREAKLASSLNHPH
ncbi:MAG TPA: serine/threonine protein kinase, partial [Terriglobales bacterium]|nr:serine/threonine protein kinase [Terriglobales bacterium]